MAWCLVLSGLWFVVVVVVVVVVVATLTGNRG